MKRNFNLHDILKIKDTIPRIVGNMALNHFLLGFRKGGYQTDSSASGWAPRKRPELGGRRALLVKTGAMRSDIKLRSVTFNKTRIASSSIPYSGVHNYGSRRIPKREFLGHSKKLDIKINRLIAAEIKKITK